MIAADPTDAGPRAQRPPQAFDDRSGDARDAAGAATAPVSVVVPCFRCGATIDDAIASIVAQTRRPAEVLLVDDGSGDGTLSKLHRIAAAHAPGWIRVIGLADNGGPSTARNVGWEQASQPYLAFLDSDDCWAPRKLELQMAALAADPSIALIAHPMLKRPRGTAFPPLHEPLRTQRVGRLRLLFHNPFPTASVVLRRDLAFRFDPAVWYSEDYLLWSQILFSGHRCARLNQVLAHWNEREPGAVGLSDNVDAIHDARRTLRRRLLREGLISRPEYLFARAVGVASRARRRLALALARPSRPGASAASP